jgi:hypothetical protein
MNRSQDQQKGNPFRWYFSKTTYISRVVCEGHIVHRDSIVHH